MLNEESGESLEREAMDTRSEALLNGTDGTFNFTDMTVGRNDVKMNRGQVGSNAFELVVAVNAGDGETAVGISLEYGFQRKQDGVMVSIRDGGRGAVTNVAGYGVEKGHPLDIKEISTKCNVEMMFGDWGGKGNGVKSRDMGRSYGLGGSALEVWHVRAINGKGAGGVGRGNWAVMKKVLS